MYGYDWQPYVSVGQKKANARKYAAEVAKKQKRTSQPIKIEGRKIAKSFWGKAWCDHVDSLSDYKNRLPRGRTYVRNGSVVDLVITPGKVKAIVAGSEPYEISISIDKLDKQTWNSIKKDCSQSIDSLLDLLGGRLSDGVMERLTNGRSGCFPTSGQIEMDCDCPDGSVCCKHLAAVMYGIGSRLDSEPELLFLLRGVNQEELISQAVSKENLAKELQGESNDLAGEDLGAMFGIELDSSSYAEASRRTKQIGKPHKSASSAKTVRKKKQTAKKKVAKKKVAKKAMIKSSKAKKKVRKSKPAKGAEAKKKVAVKKKATAKRKAVKTPKATSKKKATAKKTTVKSRAASPKTTSKKKKATTKKVPRKKKASPKSATLKKKTSKAMKKPKVKR